MAYSSFTLDEVAEKFVLKVREGRLLDSAGSVAPPPWLVDVLARFHPMALLTEQSRREFIVAPILVACRELVDNQVFIYAGPTLNVDAELGLQGECDYLLAFTPPTPLLEKPLLMVVEAKKHDIEFGLGQCAAQMIAARIYNEKRKRSMASLFGCVTTGEAWQLTKLHKDEFIVHDERYYIKNLDQVLWMLTTVLKEGIAEAVKAAAQLAV